MRTALTACLLMALPGVAAADVRVVVGPTPIPGGDAKSAGDITVINEKLAFALAVQSPVPYGVPRAAIVDLAPVVNGRIGRDCVVFADFIPNDWSAWPSTYQKVQILERGPGRAVVRAVRDWGKVTITTEYTLRAHADSVEIQTKMSNGGGALSGLLSGFTLWPSGGFFFGVPGLADLAHGPTAGALSDRVVAYDENWTVALHAPYADHISHDSKDMYRLHSLASGESRVFAGSLQVGSSGDLGPIIAAEITRKHLPSGTVHGVVTGRDGRPIEQPVIVVESRGKPYGWVFGRHGAYELKLPAGEYELYATAKNYSQSGRIAAQVTAGVDAIRDFRGLQEPGRVEFSVTDTRSNRPLDARISIAEGQKPLVEFLGRKTFFTELDRKGSLGMSIAPGDYVFAVSAGGGFLSQKQQISVSVAPGETRTANIGVTTLFDPTLRQWYSADLHHHADQAEAVTPPEELARSQLAAGLDLLFVSDHDSTVNHGALQRIAERRGVAFIPGIELSASWGHFNAYPLALGEKLAIDTGTATIDEIIEEGRRLGASIVQVNHPFIPYGYFTSVAAGVAPGGFNPRFDLIEINSDVRSDDAKVLQAAWDFWNSGHRYYLAGGTDTHDVWNAESGAVRTFAHIDGAAGAKAFAQALKAGHSYVSYGPLIFPAVMFGDELKVKPDEPFALGFDLKSTAGIKSAELVGAGAVLKTDSFADAPRETHVEFPLATRRATWYALIVEDVQGRKAYSNPIWIDAVRYPAAATRE